MGDNIVKNILMYVYKLNLSRAAITFLNNFLSDFKFI